MNILIPAHYFTDNPLSGIDTGIWNFCKHLANKGHKIFVVTTSCKLKDETRKSLKSKNINVYCIYNYKTHGLGHTESFMIFIFSLFLRIFYKFDWIFIIDEAKTPFSHFKLGAKLASRVLKAGIDEKKEIFNSGDWAYDRARKDIGAGWQKRKMPLLYFLTRFIAIKFWYRLYPVNLVGENSDILFCEGSEVLNHCRSTKRNNPVYLPLGVESYRFDNFNGNYIDTEKKFVYLFIGRILKMKGIYNLIKSFKILAGKYDNLELWIIGSSFGEYTELLKNDIKGFEDRIKILGEKNREEIVQYIYSCHVVVDPMIWANFSSVALETLYCKKPLIAPLLGNSKDFIKDNISGMLADSRDIISLTEKMDYIYSNYQESKKMGENGYLFVSKYLTWDKVAKIVEDNLLFIDNKGKIDSLNSKYENYNY